MVDDLEPKFNDDLLTNPGDLRRAKQLYPDILHVLDHPELRSLFTSYDRPANQAKKWSRRLGFTAIAFGACSLFGASAEIVIANPLTKVNIALVSAVLGIASVVIGVFGVLHHGSKREWLYRRLMTERLRQFHFQTFALRWSDIQESLESENAKLEYIKKRGKWFEEFKSQFEGHLAAQFHAIEKLGGEPWLHPSPFQPRDHWAAPQMLFDAYYELRIMHQRRYADHKLGDRSGIFPDSSRLQEVLFSRTSLVCILLLFALHLILVTFIIFEVKGSLSPSLSHILHAHWINFVAIWVAIIALAIRALEEGLKPERELERYTLYAKEVESIGERYRREVEPGKKVALMREIEKLAFDEMGAFLRTHDEARFVM
jgi:hypothetical protein